MPLQEFWNEDPDLLWVYRNSYMQKVETDAKTQREIINYSAWLNGLYNCSAIGAVFAKGKYPNSPIELENKNIDSNRQQEIQEIRIKEQIARSQIILQQQKGR